MMTTFAHDFSFVPSIQYWNSVPLLCCCSSCVIYMTLFQLKCARDVFQATFSFYIFIIVSSSSATAAAQAQAVAFWFSYWNSGFLLAICTHVFTTFCHFFLTFCLFVSRSFPSCIFRVFFFFFFLLLLRWPFWWTTFSTWAVFHG